MDEFQNKDELIPQSNAMGYSSSIKSLIYSYSTFALSLPLDEFPLFPLELVRKNEQKLQKKLEELKKVSLAKCLLIEHIGLTEPSAHRYIEKEAMDSRLPKIMIAEKIIDEYTDE